MISNTSDNQSFVTGSPAIREEERNHVEKDRYGFFLTDINHTGAGVSTTTLGKIRAKEAERTRKWQTMIRDWDATTHNKPDVVKRRIRKGVPDEIRGKVWTDLARISEYRRKYTDALTQPRPRVALDSVIIDEIDRDIDRTFPRHEKFVRKEGTGQQSLRRILQNYVMLDPVTGYCQGMGFISAMFLIYLDEEDAFYLLLSVMQRPMGPLRDMFQPNFTVAKCRLSTYWTLLKETHPQTWHHLETQGIHPTMFATEWFLTVYTRSFPFDLVTRVWDVFLHEGWKVVYRVALALIKSVSKQLKSLEFEGIMGRLKELPATIDSHMIMEAALAVPITGKRILDLEKLYGDGKSGI